MEFSRNKWNVDAKVLSVTETTRGYWLYVTGYLDRDDIYKTNKTRFDVFISNTVRNKAPRKTDIHKHIKVRGTIVFRNNGYFYLNTERWLT